MLFIRDFSGTQPYQRPLAPKPLLQELNADPARRPRILRKIRHPFTLERVAWKRDTKERLRIRRKKEKPVLNELTMIVTNRL